MERENGKERKWEREGVIPLVCHGQGDPSHNFITSVTSSHLLQLILSCHYVCSAVTTATREQTHCNHHGSRTRRALGGHDWVG